LIAFCSPNLVCETGLPIRLFNDFELSDGISAEHKSQDQIFLWRKDSGGGRISADCTDFVPVIFGKLPEESTVWGIADHPGSIIHEQERSSLVSRWAK